MPCYNPLTAYKGPGGVVFDDRTSGLPIQLPCGQCIGCRIARSRAWALRCVHESSLHKANAFITLTYNNTHLPPDGSLDVRHWQLFAKRLRKAKGKFRFFHVGEYGEENQRPHYHALIFGHDFGSDRELHTIRDGNRLYVSRSLEEIWGKGFCTVGDVTFQSAAYCSRYVMKKITGPRGADHYNGRKPEYATMSRRPGIGAGWMEKYKDEIYPNDSVVHEGRKFRPPRFYDERLDEEELSEYKIRRKRAAGKHKGDLTTARLRDREKVTEARLSLLKRTL